MTDTDRSELTRWVAEHCLGWKIHHRNTAHWVSADSSLDKYGYQAQVWYPEINVVGFNPTVDIADAWLLVDRMRELGYSFSLTAEDPPNSKVKVWLAGFGNRGFSAWHAGGDNPAEAITQACRAALEAQG